MAATPDELVAPPQEVPDAYTDAVAKLHKTARNLMVLKGIPWFIQATLSDEGFVSMEDLATRWDSPDRARETAPRELGFAPNNNRYTEVTSRLIAARMFQVVHAAQRSMGVGAHATAGPGPHTPGDTAPNLTVSCERGQLERVWEEKTKLTKPKLALQGSDQLMKRQFKLCAGGEIGFIPMKYLVSALPEPGERPWKTAKKTTVDGWDREDEVEERGEPKTRHQLERMHAVFRNTLLMCVLSFPQFGQFDITREDLESWYEWFYGEDIGGRFPPPEDHVLAIAERNAWRKIHEQMHEGSTLKAAMLSVRQDTLFWTREVYEKIRTFSRGRPQTRSSMDYAPPQKGKNKSKGKGKSRGKPGSKGKGKPPQPNNQASRGSNKQAATDPKGNQFCNNWMRGQLRTHAQVQPHPGNGPHLPGRPPPAGLPGLTRGSDPDPPEASGAEGPDRARRGRKRPKQAHEPPPAGAEGPDTGGGQARWRPPSAEQGWGRQDQRAQHPSWGQNNRTSGTTATPQPRATGAEGPDMAGTGRFPAGAKGPDTGGRAQQARVPDNWQHTATPRNTPRRQSIPLPAPNIIKQAPVVFHKSSVGLNEGGQRLSATPLTSPTGLPPGGDTFPWMENIPERLVQRLRWTRGTSPKVPPSGPIIVLLYAGKEDPTSLDSCLHANYPHLSSMVVVVDILRSGPKGNHDMLQPELYGALCTAAKQGRVVFIGGGPNCRTWSILRHIPKPGAPTPVRGRTRETLWGLPHLDQAAQTQLDEDSTLILRQMYITSCKGLKIGGFSARPKILLGAPGGPSSEQLAAQSQGMLILLDHGGGAALDGRKLPGSNLLRPVPPGPVGQEGHHTCHGSPTRGLGSNAVHTSVACGHQRVLDSQQIPLGYDGRPGQSHRCVTRGAGAHPDPLTIPGKP